MARRRALAAFALAALATQASPSRAQPAAEAPPAASDPTRGASMRAYHEAMARRRLATSDVASTTELGARVANAEAMIAAGRNDEAIALLTETVEHPRFGAQETTREGRAALHLLGQALANAKIHESARAYLRRSIAQRGAWDDYGPYARRAVRGLVEIALEDRAYEAGLADLAAVPPSAPPEVKGEISYLRGRARERSGDAAGALAAYAEVPRESRFWSQATYLSGLVELERGRPREAENLFCKVADPKRQDHSVPVYADERFFAVRDLARLALGRVAHDQLRHDDARYYYYLVPRDSDRLAEALYESATTRYEKKDYDGARELLNELTQLGAHHRYEDEARILDAYVDLARCRFPEADAKLRAFLGTYEPTRDAARRLAASDAGTRAVLSSARTGEDADPASTSVSPDQVRAVAALLRVDPAYAAIAQKRAVLEREAGGLRATASAIADVQRSLATTGGVRPFLEETGDPRAKLEDARAALGGLRRMLDDLDAAGGSARTKDLRVELEALEARAAAGAPSSTPAAATTSAGRDLPELLAQDAALATSLLSDVERTRAELAAAESILAKDALRRLDLRLSRLLRRARLGRIETVLGKKRALEVEIEAMNAGYLPREALDSLDAARFLKDSEEYWPFEGDDWPDEFVGGETSR